MSLTKASFSMIAGSLYNVVDYGASASNTDAQNKTALQTAIVAVSDAGGGTVIVPNDIDYGYRIYTPSTYPDFSGLTNGDVVVIDYANVNNESSGIVGAQIRNFFGTRQTTPGGQHNGNGELHYGDWHPYKEVMAVNPTPPFFGGGGKYRATYFCGAEDSTGQATWGAGNGDVTGGAYGTTIEELSGYRIFSGDKYLFNLATNTWWITAGRVVFGIDRYSACWAFNDSISRTVAYKFRFPDGIHSKEVQFVADTAALSPNLRLVNLQDNQRFDIVAGTGTLSYSIQAHAFRRILLDTNSWTHITDGSAPVSTAVHTIEKTGLSEGNEFLSVIAPSFSQTARFFATTNGGSNGGATGIRVGTNSVTGRSINAGGTINASGTDYAEYEQNNGLTIAKGSIVGFKADGTLTLTYSEAVRFGIKSTNPSYVGGDTWGSDDAIGECPEEPTFVPDVYSGPANPGQDIPEQSDRISDEQYAQVLAEYHSRKSAYDAAFAEHQDKVASAKSEFEATVFADYLAAKADYNARLEAARLLVDRIAYSGKVPVNVTGATPGGYILAVDQGGLIAGEFVADPDFAQYKQAVGRVNRILPDGCAEVAVIIH